MKWSTKLAVVKNLEQGRRFLIGVLLRRRGRGRNEGGACHEGGTE
jgi:hypothetical protein